MTAKEQGLPELPETPFCLRQHDETGRTTITDGPIDPILWQRWNKGSNLYTAAQMRAYALAALASDTGERGVAVAGLVPAWLAECDRLNGGAHMPFTGAENSITALTLNRCAYELSTALRAQPAGGGDIPQWALPAVESALAMLDEQGYAHTDLAAFRDWLKESTP